MLMRDKLMRLTISNTSQRRTSRTGETDHGTDYFSHLVLNMKQSRILTLELTKKILTIQLTTITKLLVDLISDTMLTNEDQSSLKHIPRIIL